MLFNAASEQACGTEHVDGQTVHGTHGELHDALQQYVIC
jgi:hypothetical protein